MVTAAERRIMGVVRRHPVLTVIAVAFLARAVVAVGVALFFHSTLVPDDKTYTTLASDAARGLTHGWNPYAHTLYRETGGYSYPLTWLYDIFGAHVLVGQLWSAALGSATAGCVAALALEIFDWRWAAASGLAAGLFPSQVLWSSITLKDAAVWAALAGIAVVLARARRMSGWRLLAPAVIASGLLLTLGHLREHTLVVASWAFVAAAWFAPRPGRLARGIGAMVIAAVIPLSAGAGIGGMSFAAKNVGTLAQRRAANAVGAASAIVRPTRTGSRALSTAPSTSASDDAFAASITYLPRGLVAIALEPFPSTHSHNLPLLFARLETLVWYPVLALAVLGLSQVWRRRGVLAFPLLVGVGITCLYALTEGNLGTAYRHRGEAVWAAVLMAVVGVHSMACTWHRRRAQEDAQEDTAVLVGAREAEMTGANRVDRPVHRSNA